MESKWEPAMGTFFDLKHTDIDFKEVDFSKFKGKVLLVTNVACF